MLSTLDKFINKLSLRETFCFSKYLWIIYKVVVCTTNYKLSLHLLSTSSLNYQIFKMPAECLV